MPVLGDVSVPSFIQRYWQQEPLLVRGALPDVVGLINGDDLAGIACQDDAEARIISQRRETWDNELGPFEAERFAELPASGWTLLVQAVDQWVPEVAALLDHFRFLPRWRLDDVMISYAVDGGGVGPHFDHYDVFLVQAAGTRRWRIGPHCDDDTPLRDHPDLRLLREFEAQDEHRLEAGDLLYLPAGRAHWGEAIGEGCITISVGFRAPSHEELVLGAAEQLVDGLSESARYRDSAASIDDDPFLINAMATEQALAAWPGSSAGVGDGLLREALTHALGIKATESRYPEKIEAEVEWTTESLAAWLAHEGPRTLEHHPASRLAYRVDDAGEGAHLYVDGYRHATTARFARELCHGRIAEGAACGARERELLLCLINAGSVRAL